MGLYRNIGLFGILELVKSRETMEPLSPFNSMNDVMGQVNRFLLDNGVYTMIRWHGVMTNPPLCITEEQLGEAFDVVDKALEIADQAMEGVVASERVGFIGLGIMGRPMARHLLDAGVPADGALAEPRIRSTSWRRPARPGPRRRPRSRPPPTSSSRCCPTRPTWSRCCSAPTASRLGAAAGSLVIDMSSIDPIPTRGVRGATRRRRTSTMLDAPVSGGEKGAIDAALSIMVGGPPEAFAARDAPARTRWARTSSTSAPSGAGQIAKACNQLVVAATIEAVAEALVLAERAGVDAAKVREALLGGFAGSKILEVHGQRMLDRAFEPGFRARLHRKDARIVLDTAKRGRRAGAVVRGGGPSARPSWSRAGGGELDHSGLFTLLDEA